MKNNSINDKLRPFYDEIAAQNRTEIMRLRVYSFLYSFKHISPTLPMKEPVNLNRLPSIVLKAYKIIFIIVMLVTYVGSLIHIAYLLLKKERFRKGLLWVLLYSIIWYFPFINTYANVLGDANRFRYPADMLIIGLFVAFGYQIYKLLSQPGNIFNPEKSVD